MCPFLVATAGADGLPPWGIGWLRDLLEAPGFDAALPWNSLWLIQLFVVSCLVFHILEHLGTRVIEEGSPGVFQPGWFADLTGALVDGPALGYLTEIAVVSLVLLAPAAAGTLGRWPGPAQFALYFLGNDFGRYWLHRWYHESDFLWRFHRVHHTATQMSALTSFRVHLFEAIPKYALLVLPFKLLGIHPWTILAYSAIDLVKGFWHHANLRTYIGKGNLLFNSAEQHWWHHSVEAKGQYANFGSILSIWDRLFGTFYWPRGRWPDRIGVRDIEEFPEDYLGRFTSMLRADEEYQAQTPAEEPTPEFVAFPSGKGRPFVERKATTETPGPPRPPH